MILATVLYMLSSTVSSDINVDSLSMYEITTAITLFKRNKSLGDDALSAEIPQTDTATSTKIIHLFLTETWQRKRCPLKCS